MSANQLLITSDLHEAKKKLITAAKEMDEAKTLYFAARRKWEEADKVFRQLDRQAAMIDGRYKVIEPQKKGDKGKRRLTKEDMAEVLAMI